MDASSDGVCQQKSKATNINQHLGCVAASYGQIPFKILLKSGWQVARKKVPFILTLHNNTMKADEK